MNNLRILMYDNDANVPPPPLERWHGRFHSIPECHLGPWQGSDVLLELTKS